VRPVFRAGAPPLNRIPGFHSIVCITIRPLSALLDMGAAGQMLIEKFGLPVAKSDLCTATHRLQLLFGLN
jgi:hypothetical protein